MTAYSLKTKRRFIPRRIWVILIVGLVLIVAGAAFVQQSYYANLRPLSSSTQKQYVTVASGSSLSQISHQLQAAGLIRSSQAFEWYVSIHDARDKLQAGTYSFTPSQSTETIAQAIIDGKVATDLVTILPGQRIDQVRQAFIKSGFDAAAVDAALNPTQYRANYPALADNPASASLEGFLYPDSFQKTDSTDPQEIIAESLTEMQAHLTTDIRTGFAAHSLTVYQGVTLASMIEKEVPNQSDREQAAQVFLKRLQSGMMLRSDPTAYYGAIKAGVAPTLNYDSPYNTYLHTGLPVGPIATVTDSSLRAVAHPANTDWLFFVAGDDGTTHFSKTFEEHADNINKYCHKLCSQAQ